jgi:hypothetical protein
MTAGHDHRDGIATSDTAQTSDRCTATAKSTGERCKRRPHPGADVCVKHGAGAKQVRAAAKRRLALGEAEKELSRLGVPIEVDPAEAMLQMVWLDYGQVVATTRWLADSPDDLRQWDEVDRWAKAEQDEERDRLVRHAKMCRDAGVEEHRVRLIERQGEMLVTILRTLLASLAGALVSAGLAEAVVLAVMREQAPTLFRQAVSVASGDAS